jgi:peroxiredoxin
MPFERANGRLLRSLTLPDLNGEPVDTFRWRGSKPLVVLFHDGVSCAPCADLLRALAADAERFTAEGAQLISVSSGTSDADKALAQAIAPQVLTLFDAQGHVRRGQNFDSPALVITDRHSEIFALWTSEADQLLPDLEDVYGWLVWIEAQCDTCSNFSWNRTINA